MKNDYSRGTSHLLDRPLRLAQPFSLEAEQAVIGALLADPVETHHELAGLLEADHFYDAFCRSVYAKAVEMVSAGQTPDAIVLGARLEGTLALTQQQIIEGLDKIFHSYPMASNARAWAEVIIDKHVERQIASTGELLARMAHAQDLSREQKISQAQTLVADVGMSMATDTLLSAEQMVAQTVAMIEGFSLNGGGLTGVPTGFRDLDQLTSGMGAGDLIVVGARPSMGKTAFLLSVGKHCCSVLPKDERLGMLLFSLEMGATQIGLRWLATRYGIDMQHMRSGQVSAEENERLQIAVEESAEIPFHLEESGSITMERLAAVARRKHRQRRLGLIGVDYLQLMDDGGTGGDANKAERIGNISRKLKMLAKELGVPVIALSQLSRKLEERADKRPTMADLRDSGSIEQDADVIMFVYRDEYYNPNTPDQGIAEIIIAKQRNGPTGTVRLVYDKPTTSFLDPGLVGRPF